jgi:Glycosyl transferase family 2
MPPLAICAIFKNEGPYILEWIAYHRALGFDHFVLYDNASTDGGANIIRASSLSRHCTIIDWPHRPGQLPAYRDFIQNFAARFEWVAFIDLDEFLLPLGDAGIRDLLRGWSEFSAVLVSWRVFGPSGWIIPPNGLVIENYDMRSSDEMPVNHHIKSIVKCAHLRDTTRNPHEFVVKGPVCNTAGQAVPNTAIQPDPCHQTLVLNHYMTRSRRDWLAKVYRGDAMFDHDDQRYDEAMFDHFAEISHIKDERIKQWASRVRELLADNATLHSDSPATPTALRQERVDDMEVSQELVQLGRGLFSLALVATPSNDKTGLPAARVSLAPAPDPRPDAVNISTVRSDGWLTLHDEPALVRVNADDVQLLVTLCWQAADGPEAKPRLSWRRLNAVYDDAQNLDRKTPVAPPSASSAEVLVHVHDVGDIEGSLGQWIGQPQSRRWIEGFHILPTQSVASDEIQYRAVLGQNWYSPWLNGGSFCGSRGLALPLRGFCIRLLGAAATKYVCIYTARFVDGSQASAASPADVCAAVTFAPLEAFQVVLTARRT